MAQLIGFLVAMIIYLWLSGVFGKESQSNQKFGDGKNRYDFKDYVNNKADKYNK